MSKQNLVLVFMSDKMIHVVSLKEVYVVGNIPFIMQTPRVCSSLQDDIVPSASAVNGNRNKKHQFNRFPDLFFLEGSWKCERQQRASFNLVCTEKKTILFPVSSNWNQYFLLSVLNYRECRGCISIVI